MNQERIKGDVEHCVRLSSRALTAAADLATLVDHGVSPQKVIPQATMVASAIITAARLINTATSTIEMEAYLLEKSTAAKVLRGKRIEIRVVR